MTLKAFIYSEGYQEFLSFLEKERQRIYLSMESCREEDDLRRLQGQLFLLRKFERLKETLTSEEKR